MIIILLEKTRVGGIVIVFGESIVLSVFLR